MNQCINSCFFILGVRIASRQAFFMRGRLYNHPEYEPVDGVPAQVVATRQGEVVAHVHRGGAGYAEHLETVGVCKIQNYVGFSNLCSYGKKYRKPMPFSSQHTLHYHLW